MPLLGVLIKPMSSICSLQCAYCNYLDILKHRSDFSYGMMKEQTLEFYSIVLSLLF